MLFTTKAQLTAAIKRAESAEALAERMVTNANDLERVATDAPRQIETLQTRLAAFTGPRDRNERGHFLPTVRRAS